MSITTNTKFDLKFLAKYLQGMFPRKLCLLFVSDEFDTVVLNDD